MSLGRPLSPAKSNDNVERNKENWTPKRLVFPEGGKQNSPMKHSSHNKENTPNRANCEPRKNTLNASISHQKQVSNTYTRPTLSVNATKSPASKLSPSKRTASKLPLSPHKSPSKGLKTKQQPSALAVFTWLPFAVKFLTYEEKKSLANVELVQQVVEHEQLALKQKIKELEARLQDQTMQLIEKDERLDTDKEMSHRQLEQHDNEAKAMLTSMYLYNAKLTQELEKLAALKEEEAKRWREEEAVLRDQVSQLESTAAEIYLSHQAEKQSWEDDMGSLARKIECMEAQSADAKSVHDADRQQWAADKAKLNQHLYTLEIGCLNELNEKSGIQGKLNDEQEKARNFESDNARLNMENESLRCGYEQTLQIHERQSQYLRSMVQELEAAEKGHFCAIFYSVKQMLARKGVRMGEVEAKHLWQEVRATRVAKEQWPDYIRAFLKNGKDYHLPWMCQLRTNACSYEIRE